MSLRKEMAVAIFLGLLFGGGVAFAFRAFPDKLDDKNVAGVQSTEAPRENPTPTPILDESVSLEILLPEQQALVTDEHVTVSGKTSPQSLVALTSAVDEAVVIAGTDGTFSGSILLTEGVNEVTVVSITSSTELEKTLIVNYSPE